MPHRFAPSPAATGARLPPRAQQAPKRPVGGEARSAARLDEAASEPTLDAWPPEGATLQISWSSQKTLEDGEVDRCTVVKIRSAPKLGSGERAYRGWYVLADLQSLVRLDDSHGGESYVWVGEEDKRSKFVHKKRRLSLSEKGTAWRVVAQPEAKRPKT